jgi:hypothetical protein
MIRALLRATLSLALIAGPGHAQGLTGIRTPPAEALAEFATEEGLRRLALANLIASNCQVEGLLPGDAALIAGSAQEVAALMGLTTEGYFHSYIGQALAQLAAPEACQREAHIARDSAARLRALGGQVLAP